MPTPLPARYFVDPSGRYAGAFAGIRFDDGSDWYPAPPAGALEVAGPPPDTGLVWRAGAWGRDLEPLRAARLAELDALLQARLAHGLEHKGKRLQLDDKSQGLLTAAFLVAEDARKLGQRWDPGFAWRTLDNGWLPLPTSEAMAELGRTAFLAVQALRRVYWQHKDALRAAATVAELERYDLAAGWPA